MNRETLRKFVPPILIEIWRALGKRTPRALPEWEYSPGGRVEEAGAGWDAPAAAKAEREKWPAFLELVSGASPLGIAHEAKDPSGEDLGAHNAVMSFAYVLRTAAAGKRRVSMLDWGGGLGHYRLFAGALAPDLEIAYRCKDTEFFRDAGSPLHPAATFVVDESEALKDKYDLVMASSSLQYSRDWKKVLGGLASAAAPYLYVTRLPLVEKAPSFTVLQRPQRYGYATEYACWFFNRAEFLEAARRCGLELLREFVVGEGCSVAGAPEQCRFRGFLFRARA